VAKRRLEKAIAATSDKHTFEIDWKAFMLRADFPAEGVSKEDYMGKRFGSVKVYREKVESMKQVFADEGVVFNPESQRTGSSLASHRIIVFAKQNGKQNEMVEELFKRYITEKQWVGDPEVCIDAAASIGLDKTSATQFMQSPAGLAEVQMDLDLGRQMQVTGVPFFVVNDTFALSGAQDVEAFMQVFEQA
jgi:predicted DsbA family dithiol-disulfide isomerase